MKHWEMVKKAREACACWRCRGEVAPTNLAPTSCAMPTLLAYYMEHGYSEGSP